MTTGNDITRMYPKVKKRPDKRERIVGRLRHALDLMIWGDETGKPVDWNDAARAMNISARSMRKSLERQAVRAYLREQKQVVRATISAKSLWRLDELAAQRSNMNAAVNAIRVIDEGEATAPTGGGNQTPGVTIRIVNVIQPPPARLPVPIDLDPPSLTIEHDPAGTRDPQSQGHDE